MAIRFTVIPPSAGSRPSVIAFDLERIAIGRSSVCDLRIPHGAVSLSHATVTLDGMGYAIMDEGSTNGTRLNGAVLPPMCRQPLRSDDVIEIAGYRILPALSVAMDANGGAERTDAMARALISGGTDELDARLEIIEGPDAGASLTFPAAGRRTVTVGHDDGCDLRLSDPRLTGLRLDFKPEPMGWTLVVSGGGDRIRPARLADGKIISIGGTRIRFSDPVDARMRSTLEAKVDLLADQPLDRDSAAGASPITGEVTPSPGGGTDTHARQSNRRVQAGEITDASREERRSQAEYGWMVLALGIVAFLASLALLLALVF